MGEMKLKTSDFEEINSFVITDNSEVFYLGRDAKKFNYQPKEDITVYELALIIGAINGGFYAIASLPENAKRHFVEEK